MLDVVLNGVIRPGNRVELRDGLHRAEDVAAAFPEGWAGTVDLTVCQSELVALALKERCPECRCVQSGEEILVGPRVELSATVLELMKSSGGDYASLLRELLNAILR